MPAPSSLSLPQELAPWHEFYSLLGSASATLIGLLFVAASVGAGAFSASQRAAMRMFLSASVIHFSGTLTASLIVLAPVASWLLVGVLILCCGLFGLTYHGIAWYDAVRDGLHRRIEMDDRFWYAAFPAAVYLSEAASGVTMALRCDWGCIGLAGSLGLLLMVGIHNAWDITLWSLTRRQRRQNTDQAGKKPGRADDQRGDMS